MIEFFIPMESPPTTTFQAKKVNWKNKVIYKPDEVKKIEEDFRAWLAQYIPEEKLEGPLRLITKWCYPYPKYFTKEMRIPTWKDTKPDTDNTVKIVKDQMTKLGYWGDDSQVASEVIEKFWAEPTGVYFKIEPLV